MIDPNTIITEGRLDADMFEDPALVFVDLALDEAKDAEDDLLLGGKNDDMSLVDIVAQNDPEFIKMDRDEVKVQVDDMIPQSQR